MLRLLGNAVKIIVSCLCGLAGFGLLLVAFSGGSFRVGPMLVGLFFMALGYMPWVIGGNRRVTAVAVSVLGGSTAVGLLGLAYEGFAGGLVPRDCADHFRSRGCEVWNWAFDLGGSRLMGAVDALAALAAAVVTIKVVKHLRRT